MSQPRCKNRLLGKTEFRSLRSHFVLHLIPALLWKFALVGNNFVMNFNVPFLMLNFGKCCGWFKGCKFPSSFSPKYPREVALLHGLNVTNTLFFVFLQNRPKPLTRGTESDICLMFFKATSVWTPVMHFGWFLHLWGVSRRIDPII